MQFSKAFDSIPNMSTLEAFTGTIISVGAPENPIILLDNGLIKISPFVTE